MKTAFISNYETWKIYREKLRLTLGEEITTFSKHNIVYRNGVGGYDEIIYISKDMLDTNIRGHRFDRVVLNGPINTTELQLINASMI
jgi:hypothetical protein